MSKHPSFWLYLKQSHLIVHSPSGAAEEIPLQYCTVPPIQTLHPPLFVFCGKRKVLVSTVRASSKCIFHWWQLKLLGLFCHTTVLWPMFGRYIDLLRYLQQHSTDSESCPGSVSGYKYRCLPVNQLVQCTQEAELATYG